MNPEKPTSVPDRLPLAEREGRRSPWLRWGVSLLFSLLAGVLGYLLWLSGPTGVQAQVRLERGQGALAVGRTLERAGLVRSGQLFAVYLRASGRDKLLKPGVYQLEGDGVRRLAIALTEEAQPLTVRLTFPEGWRMHQMALRLSQNGLPGEKFLELAEHPPADLRPSYVQSPTLEGFLFPATYTFPLDATAREIIQAMLARFEQELTPEVRSRLAQEKLSVQQWVTLASIVQAEAAHPEEKPLIAGIFLNRLEAGMPLQADPTVAYGLGKALPELSRPAGDFASDTPYNTYRVAGLPPGAISNPGSEALRAVLEPQRTDARGRALFYFFHNRQGKLFVNPDFASHSRDLARYR